MFNTQQNPISFNIVCSVKYLRYNRSLSILTNNMYQIIRILCDLVQICFSFFFLIRTLSLTYKLVCIIHSIQHTSAKIIILWIECAFHMCGRNNKSYLQP